MCGLLGGTWRRNVAPQANVLVEFALIRRTEVSDRAKSLIAILAVVAVFWVLVLPIPELDATARSRPVAIALPPAAILYQPVLLLMTRHEISPRSTAEDTPELLAILCVRNC